MSLPGQLYELQQIDIELQKKQQLGEQIVQQLSENQALLDARSKFASQEEQLADTKRRQKTAEWELDDLQEKINRINGKLYSDTIKNPKELLNLEHELESFKKELRKKEDALLDLMSQVETMQVEIRVSSGKLEKLEQGREQKEKTLNQEKAKVEPQLISLNQKRQELRYQIDPEALNLYEETKLTKEPAIVRVEQGRCQGCHVTLPMTEWRRVRSGELVQCGNCGRILYLE
jgi:hypothetical protein